MSPYWILPVLRCTKHTPGDHIHIKDKKPITTQEILKYAYPSILCHCKYSMKEYTTKTYLYFNMYYVILNLQKQLNVTKAKIIANLLNLALNPIEQL